VDAPWKLLLPDGPAPASGWPLVVCLHGWGENADHFARLCRPLVFAGAAFLFPQGPWSFEQRTMRSFEQQTMGKIRIGHAWYLYDATDEPFRSTLGRAEGHLLGLLDTLIVEHPIDPARIALLGFSQGAYTAYFIALRNTDRFRAMVALGGGRLKPEFVEDRLVNARRIPFLLLHGREDSSVPLERTELMRGELASRGFPVDLQAFSAGHEMTAEMLGAASGWLARELGSIPSNA
ncbi:MAG: phospholipase/carboxylesterase, partial [bacterium]